MSKQPKKFDAELAQSIAAKFAALREEYAEHRNEFGSAVNCEFIATLLALTPQSAAHVIAFTVDLFGAGMKELGRINEEDEKHRASAKRLIDEIVTGKSETLQ